MIDIFFETVPFFALIALGYWAGRTGFFTEEATAYLTKFVFYFALSAMLFRFSANLTLADVWDANLIAGYLVGTLAVYLIATGVAMLRRLDVATAAVEAQCAAIGNVGFLGVPMLTLLLGEAAIGPIMMALAVDLIVFSSLIVILITGSRDGRFSLRVLRTVGLGLIRNPMILAISTGLLWSALEIPIPVPMNDFLALLGAAATPGALFAIGASLASKSAERLSIAGWLSFCKLALHPALVAIGVIYLFPVDPYTATVVISAAALPVAGNVYILAQHYGVAPQRVSATILVSTVLSIVTVSAIIGTISPV
ncbi:AEC family transporter [Roseobacter weihaiensis]|uniref:AEC family transporter n=1 Tax=Roseobacter weihaiensis TaxID=2763262 RepID=UPI001D09EF59|nr:AEC family transporter [Roseobacter sp. H9]